MKGNSTNAMTNNVEILFSMDHFQNISGQLQMHDELIEKKLLLMFISSSVITSVKCFVKEHIIFTWTEHGIFVFGYYYSRKHRYFLLDRMLNLSDDQAD